MTSQLTSLGLSDSYLHVSLMRHADGLYSAALVVSASEPAWHNTCLPRRASALDRKCLCVYGTLPRKYSPPGGWNENCCKWHGWMGKKIARSFLHSQMDMNRKRMSDGITRRLKVTWSMANRLAGMWKKKKISTSRLCNRLVFCSQYDNDFKTLKNLESEPGLCICRNVNQTKTK